MAASLRPVSTADFNRDCRCITIDRPKLAGLLEHAGLASGLSGPLLAQAAPFFASVPVYVGPRDLARMRQVIQAVESVALRTAYRDAALAKSPAIAHHPERHLGVFFGYDFHLGDEGPQLIEINTNAGGALLNAFLARAQRACCREMDELTAAPDDIEGAFLAMFQSEFRRSRGDAPLSRIAIVDDEPEKQFMFPEFVLFRELFKRAGYQAEIVDARALTYDGKLRGPGGEPIDLVYNRCTDFYFDDPTHAALREAYLRDAAVITPHPRAHALYADKRNLTLLSDLTFLTSLALPAATVRVLADGIPKTITVDPRDAETLWAQRKEYFFKPMHGFGSKAAYRGDKLTKTTFAELVQKPYVAQRTVPPSERMIEVEGKPFPLKIDIRAYVYAGEVQLFAARLYMGQTTNFRTAGGGFAPVFTRRGPSSITDFPERTSSG